ncbi:hypothetical protein B0H14DRAFT_2581451 [Mycena olivaceomarginata]|nr:hypothetical protein B0H14DRAFT_2581451 [Mycena olivaceomarginata]
MPPRFTLLLFVPLFVCHWALATNPFTQYAVDSPDPNYVTAGQFGAKFGGAEATIVAWADKMASYGPWSIFFPLAALHRAHRLLCRVRITHRRLPKKSPLRAQFNPDLAAYARLSLGIVFGGPPSKEFAAESSF